MIQNTKLDGSREQGSIIKKFKATMPVLDDDWTINPGPFLLGWSVGLDDTTINEALGADPQGIDDIPATEEGNRKVFPMWIIPQNWAEPGAQQAVIEQLHEIEDFPFREVPEGSSLQLWAKNIGTDTPTILNHTLRVIAAFVTEWMRD